MNIKKIFFFLFILFQVPAFAGFDHIEVYPKVSSEITANAILPEVEPSNHKYEIMWKVELTDLSSTIYKGIDGSALIFGTNNQTWIDQSGQIIHLLANLYDSIDAYDVVVDTVGFLDANTIILNGISDFSNKPFLRIIERDYDSGWFEINKKLSNELNSALPRLSCYAYVNSYNELVMLNLGIASLK